MSGDGARPAEMLTDPVEQRALECIDRADLVALTRDLVALRTLPGRENEGQDVVAARMEDLGLAVETWRTPTDALSDHPAFSAEYDRDEIAGVVGRVGGGGGPRLLVDAHLDVVPTGDRDRWSSPPFDAALRDGRLYGRGACDMKGGLAAALHAAAAVRRTGVDLDGEVTIASVIGEEDGGSGTLALLEEGVTADGCIIPEPTRLAVAPAVAGALSWRITVEGRAAHGCLREEGVSAIERFMPVHRAVLDLERRRNAGEVDPLFAWLDRPFAICGGRIAGGDWPSSEAAWLTWEGRYGVAPGEDLDVARRQLEDAVAAAAAGDDWLAEHPPTVQWWGGQFLPARTDPEDAVVTVTRDAAATVTGTRPALRAMPYGCDMGLTVGVGGTPTVVFGPGDIRDAHRPDESVSVDDLEAAARALALTMLRFCRDD